MITKEYRIRITASPENHASLFGKVSRFAESLVDSEIYQEFYTQELIEYEKFIYNAPYTEDRIIDKMAHRV